MTVRINFLPKTYQPPKQLGTKEWAAAAAAAVAVVATSVFYMSAFASTGRLENQVKTDSAKHQEVKTLLAQAAEIKAREEQVVKAEAELKALAGRHWSSLLLTMTELTPQQVTWNSVNVEANQIALKGTSRGLVDVAQLFGGLIDNSSVEQVSLRYVNEQGVPVNVTVKSSDPKGIAESTLTLKTLRQLEFEMVITLVRSEGGARPNGA